MIQHFNSDTPAGRVLVGMSGGVDSSVAALLLMEQGFQVSGATLRLYDGEDYENKKTKTCCSLSDVEDARSVCDRMGIRHYVFNFKERFERAVIDKFVNSYQKGLTPNPCIDCNRFIKFSEMLTRAELLDMDYIATGHYAVIRREGDRFLLERPRDRAKDQTYVLYAMTQAQLSKTLMPLGSLTKREVRDFAEEHGFVNAAKPDSQDICFVPDGDYAGFIARKIGGFPEGDFVDLSGRVIGRHSGMLRYTVGQRRGLGMGFGRPLYVVRKNPVTNEVVLGEESDLYSSRVLVGDVNFIPFDGLTAPLSCTGKLRYRQNEQPCRIIPLDEHTVLAEFESPQRAVTAGQAAVFYDGDTVIGGGTILSGE